MPEVLEDPPLLARRDISKTLELKQERFAHEYLKDLNPAEAYLRAGYEVKDLQVAKINGLRLLRDARVLDIIDRAQVERIKRINIDGDWVILRWQYVYLQASRDRKYTAALKALDAMAKLLGLYEEHNKQKSLTPLERLEELRERLRLRGIDLDAMQTARVVEVKPNDVEKPQ